MTDCDRRSFLARAGGAVALGFLPEFATAAPRPQDGPLPVAVIGVGRQGRSILGELQKMEDTATVVAICDSDDRRLRSGARRAPGAEAFGDHRAMLEKRRDVEAVFIATPTHLHRDIAVDALEAGRHVYCEAPLASTIDDCRAIVAAARNAPGLCQPGLQGRSDPVYKLAWSFYRADAIRSLVFMRGQYHRKTSWRTPTSDPARDRFLNWRLDPEVSIGLAGEFGTHQFDVFHWFADRYPIAVSGHGDIRLYHDGRKVPDTIDCNLTFSDGAHLQYNATLANSFERQHEVLCGSNGAMKLAWTHGWMFKEADAPTQGWEVYANRQQFHKDEGITLIADATKLAAQGKLKEGVGLPHDPLYYSISDFFNSIVKNEPVVCSVEEGLRATAVGILANLAIVSGEDVVIDERMLKGT
ncbi:MAG: Gfo/Idh/MocA family oxidoreductase [Planctomycetota bacterium]|nr:Gfo/Idh/MocA family oxidoreductase [Planctomycetota bacterium]